MKLSFTKRELDALNSACAEIDAGTYDGWSEPQAEALQSAWNKIGTALEILDSRARIRRHKSSDSAGA